MKQAQASNRRVFMMKLVCGPSALAAAAPALSAEKLTEADPYAKSMGFKLDTTQVDAKRFPRHTPEQKCSACQLFSGGSEDWGPCSFFGGRLVYKDGWCRNFKVRKPGAA